MLFSLFDPSTCRIWWRFYWDSSSMRSLQFVPAAWPCRRIYLGRSVVPYWERTAASNSLNHVGLTTQLRLVCGTIFTPKGLDVRPGVPLASLGLRLFCVAGVVLNHLIHSHTQTHSLTHWLTHSLIHWLTHSLPQSTWTYIHTHKLTHHHRSITLILSLPFLLFYDQTKSKEVGNMWGYPVLYCCGYGCCCCCCCCCCRSWWSCWYYPCRCCCCSGCCCCSCYSCCSSCSCCCCCCCCCCYCCCSCCCSSSCSRSSSSCCCCSSWWW